MSDKLAGLKEGDRVRITFEGAIADYGSDLRTCVTPCNEAGYSWILSDGVTAPDTFKIERISVPIRAGDTIRPKSNWGGVAGKVIIVHDDYIGVQFGGSFPSFVRADQYEKIA